MPSAGSLFASAALLVSAFARPQSHQVNPAKTSSNSKNAPVNSDEQSLYSAPTHNFGGSAAGNFHSPAFIPHGQNLRPQLPQSHSNGNSQLGTFHAPHLPGWLGGGPMSGGSPWGGRSAGHTNPYQNLPNTGVTRHYDFTLTEATIAPDGVERPGQIINGAFPGPTIEANWGDWIEVVVHNQLTDGEYRYVNMAQNFADDIQALLYTGTVCCSKKLRGSMVSQQWTSAQSRQARHSLTAFARTSTELRGTIRTTLRNSLGAFLDR